MSAVLLSLYGTGFGVRFQLTTDSEEVLVRMLECAPLGTQFSVRGAGDTQEFMLLSAQGGIGYRFVVGDEIAAENVELQPVLDRIASDLMVYVANNAPVYVFVHAGVVGWRGHALVLPGTSFAGKTTLVAELVRAGATYYSDEYAVIDELGQVHAYPRDLQMRQPGGREQSPLRVEQLKGSAGSGSLPVSLVVFAEYAELGRWNPARMSTGMAVLEMLQHSIPVQRTPARVMATLAKMMETAIAVRGERGEASDTARALLAAMDERRLVA
jgi:serine kinase of HPr protein (carbohydrate metabolism regulator)